MKRHLGVIGEKRAGKDLFCSDFAISARNYYDIKVSIHRFSDPIAECLHSLRLEKSRENMQKFSPAIRNTYGENVLSRAVMLRAKSDPADVVILQGIRWLSDERMIRDLGGVILYLTADKEIRFARSQASSEKPDEAGMSREKFELQENAETERYIPEIAARADYRIENNGNLENLGFQIVHFLEHNFVYAE